MNKHMESSVLKFIIQIHIIGIIRNEKRKKLQDKLLSL